MQAESRAGGSRKAAGPAFHADSSRGGAGDAISYLLAAEHAWAGAQNF